MNNKILSKQINRIVDYSSDSKQVNILDQRFYKRDEKYYPSVSTILQYYPKGRYFEDCIKSNAYNSEIIAQKAAGEGTQVHKAIEDFLNGEEIVWLDEYGSAKYNLDVWKMILKFADFWNTHKPELIASEYHLFSDKYEYAGTADLVVRFKDKLWLLDIKTSNSLHTSYELQLAAYIEAWNETHDEKITEAGIIWLKASTRGVDKQGKKIQGEGWQLKTFDNSIEKSFEMFTKIYDIYKLENPDAKPYTELLPTTVKVTV
jgi:hypothetical protein